MTDTLKWAMRAWISSRVAGTCTYVPFLLFGIAGWPNSIYLLGAFALEVLFCINSWRAFFQPFYGNT
jgi:hypothetical protein